MRRGSGAADADLPEPHGIMRLRQRRGAAPVGQSTRGQGLPPLVCAFGYFHSNRHRIMVSRRNLRLRRVHGDGPFVSVPVFLVPTVEKTGGQTQKDRPLVYNTNRFPTACPPVMEE